MVLAISIINMDLAHIQFAASNLETHFTRMNMKKLAFLTSLILAPLISAATPTEPRLQANAEQAFSMPDLQQEISTEYTFEQLKEEQRKLNRALGGYPASFFMANHKKQVYQKWTEILIATAKFQPSNKQEASDRVYLLGELFRNGHNMNIAGSTEEADKAISTCLHYEPESIRCQFSAALFYMTVNEQFFPEVEQQLATLKQYYGEDRNADVEIAYAYYYVYSDQYDLAVEQIDLVLSEFEELKKDSIEKFRLKQLHEFKLAIQRKQKNTEKS